MTVTLKLSGHFPGKTKVLNTRYRLNFFLSFLFFERIIFKVTLFCKKEKILNTGFISELKWHLFLTEELISNEKIIVFPQGYHVTDVKSF